MQFVIKRGRCFLGTDGNYVPSRKHARRFDSESEANLEAAVRPLARLKVVPLKPLGFAAMPREAVAAIARKGGVAAHEKGTAHEFTPEKASEAGRLGGHASQRKRQEARKVEDAALNAAIAKMTEASRGEI